MACSFRYFLLKRCQGLTGLNTTSTKKFFAAAEDAHPEAFAPLLLLAICDGREEYLLRRAEGTKAAEMFDEFVEHWHASGRPLEVYLGMLSDGDPFKTILVEWRTDSSRIEVDRKILKYVSTAFGDLLADKNMTRAEACRVTRLNKGNFYAFLKGATSKMSRKKAMNAYREIAAL